MAYLSVLRAAKLLQLVQIKNFCDKFLSDSQSVFISGSDSPAGKALRIANIGVLGGFS
jgi:hypothetical protein